MTSRAEAIMQAVDTRMKTPAMTSVTAAHVYRDLTDAIDKSVTAALAMEEGNEPEPDKALLGMAYRSLSIELHAIAKGASAITNADAICVEAHNRLFSEPTFNGLVSAIYEGETTRQRDALEKKVVVITKSYRIEYRTAANSLEA